MAWNEITAAVSEFFEEIVTELLREFEWIEWKSINYSARYMYSMWPSSFLIGALFKINETIFIRVK